jgi:hypothetical protein
MSQEWTKELPSKRGYYWWRRYKWKAIIILYVWQEQNGEWYCRDNREFPVDKVVLKDFTQETHKGGEWIGPISEPAD